MTDRIKGVHVVFEKDIREDDAESIINAIRMVKGVSSVKGNVVNSSDWMNRELIRQEISKKFFDFYKSI